MTPEPILALMSVSRCFGSGATAVRAVKRATLSVSPGEVVAIMGPSGSCKSTLLSIMGGLLTPDTGAAIIAGQVLQRLSARALAQLRRMHVGFIFQNFNLLKALSALENVELRLRLAGVSAKAARRRAAEMLQEMGLGDRAHALPRELSGGEQQRVAVARALATSPAVILADEPTGSLDSANGRTVIEMICAHTHTFGAAAVIVTHDHRVSTAVDRQLWMEDGILWEPDHEQASELRACAV